MDLNDLRGAHAGEDVWLVGSDASVGHFGDGFWAERTVIGVNRVPLHLPARYCVTKYDGGLEWLLHLASSMPDTVVVTSRHQYGSLNQPAVPAGVPNNVVVFEHRENQVAQFNADVHIPDDTLLVSYSTAGSGMHLAAWMGARTVFMVGVSGGSFGGASHVSGYYPEGTSGGPLSEMSRQTQSIADRLTVMYGTQFVTVLPWANMRLGGTTFTADYGRLN
jgi:hypothetical protein